MIQKSVTKTVKKYGNSGGVYLPSAWIGGEVEVKLLNEPRDIKKEILLALSNQLEHIVSIFLFGSYTRGEYSDYSDIDLIVVTDVPIKAFKVKKLLREKKYDFRIMSLKEIQSLIKKDALFRKSLEEARPLINNILLKELLSIDVNKKSIKERTEYANSSLEIIKDLFEIKGDNNSLIYPLIMRIKEMLLIKCIFQNKKYSIKLLEETFIKKGITKPDFFKIIGYYRIVRSGGKPEKIEFNNKSVTKMIKILEDLIQYARKKEKG